jgi:uncharacterized membrane protein YheB (UPF0754 family)
MPISSEVIIIPIIAASIGWFTNYIAIKMLFHPRIPKRVLGFTFHGVFPKRQKVLALKLGELFADRLNIQAKLEGTVKELLSKPETHEKLKDKMKDIGTKFISEELPMLSSFVSPQLFESLATRFSKELIGYLETEFRPENNSFRSSLDVKSVVAQEIEALNSSELEELLNSLLKKEFKFIELSGAVLGYLIGLLQVAISIYL